MSLLKMGIEKIKCNDRKYERRAMKYLERECNDEMYYFVL